MRWLDTDGKPQRAFPELKLRFRFNRDAATRLFEDAAASFAEIMAAADAGQPQGFGLPGMLTLSATTGLRRTESANVLGLLPGSDPNLRNEIIVITAHLDHLGRGSAVNGDSIYNGAHDNAVGVAVLLEMARALHVSNTRPRRSVLFAAVTAEEKGLLGSDYFVQAPRNDGRRIVANVNIDMPMPFVRVRDFVALGGEHSSLGTLARNAATAQGYKLSPELAPEEVGFIRSDQFSFIRHGVPALVLNSGYTAREPGVDAATLQRQFRETNYHQPSDDLNLPLDYPTAADLARIDLRILLDAANAASAPRWNAGDFFAEKFGGSR
jgi:Zn-dependent M28 family amino/carboxypeptidase